MPDKNVDRAEAALPTRTGKRFNAEQIFDLLRAGEGAEADIKSLCAAHGVTVPTYCLWKVRYAKLTLGELRRMRAVELKRAFARRAAVAAGILLALAMGTLSIREWISPSEAVAASPRTTIPLSAPAHAAPAPTPDPVISSAPAAAPPSAGASLAPPEPLHVHPPEKQAYSVQLAAVPDMVEASGKRELLKSAGYSAYLLPTTSGDLTLYRVRVGPFDSLQDAQDAVRRLKRDGHEGAWISK